MLDYCINAIETGQCLVTNYKSDSKNHSEIQHEPLNGGNRHLERRISKMSMKANRLKEAASTFRESWKFTDNSNTLLKEDGKIANSIEFALVHWAMFNISGLYIWLCFTLYSRNLNIIAINFDFANFRIYAFFLFLLFHIVLVVCSDSALYSLFLFFVVYLFVAPNFSAFFILHLWNVHMYGIGLHHLSVEERTRKSEWTNGNFTCSR